MQRNFGDDALYIKPISILGVTDKVVPEQADWTTQTSDFIDLSTDKEHYKKREKIQLTINRKGECDGSSTDVTVSVTDAQQVVPIEWAERVDAYQINENEITTPSQLKYEAERGIRVKGRCVDNGRPVRETALSLIESKPKNVFFTETDARGFFEIDGMVFYDSARFFTKIGNDLDDGASVQLIARERPNITLHSKPIHLSLIETESPQRIFSEYEIPNDTRLLKAVTIKGQKPHNLREARPYGILRNVNIVRKKDIKTEYGDLNYSLVGVVPGLLVQQVDGGWNVKITRATGLTINASTEPLVMVNDVPVGGSAGAAISMINPETVQSIEITKSLNPLYGSQGVNGVISIYTQDYITALEGGTEQVRIPTVGLLGFSTPRQFDFPKYDQAGQDYSDTDYRSSLYWAPNLDIEDANPVTFYASDLTGKFKIEVNGVACNGTAIHVVKFFSVGD